MAGEAEDLAARLRAEFPHALRNGQLVAYYQPEVELSTGRVVGAELLVRWSIPSSARCRRPCSPRSPSAWALMGELTRLMLTAVAGAAPGLGRGRDGRPGRGERRSRVRHRPRASPPS